MIMVVMENSKKVVSFMALNPLKLLKSTHTFTTHSSLLSFINPSSFLTIVTKIRPQKTILAPFHSTSCSNPQTFYNHPAHKLFDEITHKQPQPSVVKFLMLLQAVIKTEDYSCSLELLKRMNGLGVPVDAHTTSSLLDCVCQIHDIRKGSAVVGYGIKSAFLQDVFPDVHLSTFHTLIDEYILQGRVEEAELLPISQQACKEEDPESNPVVDPSTQVKYLCKSGLIITAVDLLREMVGLDLTPDMVSYTTVIDSLFKLGSEDDALDLFREMAFHIGILPNSVTYSSLLHCLRILSHEDDISKLLKDMEDKGVYVDLRTFNIFVDAYCKEGRMEDAESLVKLMIQRRMGPNVVTYRWLIDGYCFLGKMSEAWGIFVLMRRRGVIPNVDIYNSLLDGYFKDSEIEDAMDLFHEMMKLGGITYDNMGLFRVGCCTEEQELFNEVQTPNEYTFKIVLEGLCNNNQVEEAVSLFHSMGDEKFSLNIGLYNILINGARTNGKLDIARSLYNNLNKKGLQCNGMTSCMGNK